MSRTNIGIEIGDNSIKIAVLENDKVKKLVCEQLPNNMIREGQVTVPAALIDFVKEIRKKNNLPKGNATLIVPGQLVITKLIQMPFMAPDQIKLNIPYEFKDYIGAESAKTTYDYDYIVTGLNESEDNAQGTLDIFAAAVNRKSLNVFINAFGKAGIKIKTAIPYQIAWQKLIAKTQVQKEIAIVDLGYLGTNISVFKNGNFVMGKTVDVGGFQLDQTIAKMFNVDEHTAKTYKTSNFNNCLASDECIDIYNQIAIEVMKVTNFYAYSTQSRDLHDIYFCGGLAAIELLRTRIVKSTELEPHRITKLFKDSEDNTTELENSCAIAVAAAIKD